MLSEKFEKKFLILELPYNIGICTNIAHATSLHPPTRGGSISLRTVKKQIFFDNIICEKL